MFAAGLIAATAALAPMSPAFAHDTTLSLYDSNTQWFYGSSGSGYYAAMTISTNTSLTDGHRKFRINSGTTTGGVYYSGPYGDSGVTSKTLDQTWTITMKNTGATSCSVGAPGGFSCTISSNTLTYKDTNAFGATKPTSASLPATTFVDSNSEWEHVTIHSAWKATYAISGTTYSRTVGENNIHYR
ncbi:hypothetical protein ACIA59_33345 [Micromonospora haikouensis]|uniref:hypothetical protein n=1 Tax=Micromonospora haikouensis TaxID=686309 RepID=UPI0037AE5325